MAFATVIVMLALVQFMYFAIAVGRARGRHGVSAPAVSGDEHFERFHRAHQNTLEQIVIFVPAIYACAYYLSIWLAVAGGIGYLVGRFWYFRCYIKDPETRGKGMMLTVASSLLMVAGGLIGALRSLLHAGY